MTGTILLSKTNEYLTFDGKLPDRPSHDKHLLSAMVAGQSVSVEGYDLLPPSMQAYCMVADPITIPITIRELAECDLLIVSRSRTNTGGGKVFRLNKFKLLVKTSKIELWRKI